MKHKRLSIVLLLGVPLFFLAATHASAQDHAKKDSCSGACCAGDTVQAMSKGKYTCTMHSEVISDKPGKCPKCGMKLVKMKPKAHIKESHKMQKDTLMSHPGKGH